jgi:hypothetical protein
VSAPVTTQAVVFSNSGLVSGTVMLTAAPPVIVTSGNATFTSPSLTTVSAAVVPIQSDGTYSITGLPAGIYSATASVTGSLLTGNTSVTVTNGSAVTNANILIGATGALMGTVRSAASGHPPLSGVTVNLYSAGQTISVVSDSSGGYSFTDVPPGSYTVAAYDPTSNTAATLTVVVAASATTTQDILLGSGGSVVVQVSAPNGVSIANLPVSLSVATTSGTQTLTGTTNADGAATINNVPLGQLTAQVTGASGYAGSATGTLGLSGQSVTLNITLAQYGSVSGTLYTYNGQIAPGAQIQLYGYAPGAQVSTLLATTTTSAQGAYAFPAVPVNANAFTVVALLSSDGDEAVGRGTIVTGGQQVTLNLTLTGVGTLNVTVNNASGTPDGGALVTATSQFNSSYQGTTSQQGTVTLSNVLAGSVQVSATDPVTQLSAQTTVTLPPGGQQGVTLTLQPSGTIMGVVYGPDGQTPAPNATLKLYQLGAYQPTAVLTSKADGSYQFTSVALGTYVINVYDANGIFRTYATRLVLNQSGQVLTQNLTFAGIGTVNGTISNPNGTAAIGVSVQIVSQGSLVENFYAATDNQGNYSITGVPVGPFQVTAQNLGAGVGGTALGTIKDDGDIEIVNIQMVSNVVSLAQTLKDFNGFSYDVQQNGSLLNGTYANNPILGYGGTPDYNSAFQLSLYQNGTAASFTGAQTGVTSMAGQEISIQQLDLDGLNVTRSVYVPSNGYFARYLETLSNPGTTPITVDVQVSGGVEYAFSGAVPVQITSSGDAALSTADTTFVTDDDNGSNPWPYSQPSLGEAFQGPGAPRAISVASYTLPTSANGFFYPQLLYRWNSVTVPPGGQVEFLHFATQQTSSGQSTASVARLDQLPPEALNGLLPTDLASIQNFAVPQNGVSTVAPLTVPALGSVTGYVFGGDGQTPVPGAWTVLRGSDLYFGATAWQLADGAGAFDFTSAPVENYTLEATDPHSLYNSPLTNGSFAAGATNSSTNVVFSTLGSIVGSLSVPAETQYTSATVGLYSSSNQVDSATVNSDGSFTMPSAPAGTYTLQTVAGAAEGTSGAQGTPLIVNQQVTVTVGQTTTVTVDLPDTGTVQGTFTSAQSKPEVMAVVQLTGANNFFRDVITDSNGAFTLPQVPVGAYTLTATEPQTSLVATANITITAGGTVTQNLQIVNGATINLTVNLANGAPASNSSVTTQRNTATYSGQVLAGVTNSSGQLQIVNVPVGAFTVIAYYPGLPTYSSSIYVTANGSVTANGQVIPLTVTLPATSTIAGVVTTFSGGTVASPNVTLNYTAQSNSAYVGPSITAGNGVGAYSINPVLAATAASLTANAPPSYVSSDPVNITTAAAGQTLTQNLKLPVNATVVATGVDGNGNPLVNCAFLLYLQGTSSTSPDGSYAYQICQPGGTATFNNVLDGTYSLELSDGSGNFLGSAQVVIPTSDDGKTVQVTVQTGFTGTISGALLAADGVTPVPPATYTVNLIDSDTQDSGALATVTSTDGTFSFPNITTGRDGYIVQAQMTQSPTETYYEYTPVSVTGKITANGQTQTQNITLPIPVIQGVVYQSDGVTPAANPNVLVTVPNDGNPVTFYGISDAQGNYSVAVPAADQASVVANANGLTTQAQVTVNYGDTVDTQNVILHDSGTVSGTVVDTSGNPVPYLSIAITSTGSTYTLITETAINGTYTVPYVATGTITVQAGGQYSYDCDVSGTGALADNGDTVNINITYNYSTCSSGGNTMLMPAPLTDLQHPASSGSAANATFPMPDWLTRDWLPARMESPGMFAWRTPGSTSNAREIP